MEDLIWKDLIQSFDARRDIIIPGSFEETVLFSARQFIQLALEAIEKHGFFAVAVSGGQTPHAIFKALSQPLFCSKVDWTKVLCFWSDERSVPPSHPDNNYAAAMQAGLAAIPLLPEHIFRMRGEGDIEQNARDYEKLIRQFVPSLSFDLMMLGMGEDGHTASLFPRTHGLHTQNRLAIANYVPQKKTWRLSLTFDCINASQTICIYALGKNKQAMVKQVFISPYQPDDFPVQRVGTSLHKALWILDHEAGQELVASFEVGR